MATIEEARQNRMKNNSGGQWVGNLRGENGDDFITDTATHTGMWTSFYVWEDTVISAIVRPKSTGDAYLTSITIVKGTMVFGEFTAITLTSGKIQAFLF